MDRIPCGPLSQISRRSLLTTALAFPFAARAASDWIPLFDGRSLDGWKASENIASWRVADGLLAADGPRSHLFYTGPVLAGDFKNFEFQADVMSRPGCNSGIFFHTQFQQNGFPAKGFEVQINNTYIGEGNYRERKKTGSLYAVRDVYKAFVNDDTWFRMHIVVRGNNAQVRLDDVLVVDYVQPDRPVTVLHGEGRVIDRGTFALQCHNDGSRAFFKNIMVRPLAADLAGSPDRPLVDDTYREILRMNAENYPVVDYHVHLKKDLTLDDALRQSRAAGVQYGIAINFGLKQPATTDADARKFIQSLKGQPVFVAMQAEGREWLKMISKETIAMFDYVFTDCMTFTDDNGHRMRLWIKEEVPEISDRERFMDMLVDRIRGVLNNEPIDIYVNPTFLPEQIAAQYDELWTPDRMSKVIEAAVKNNRAIEINNRYRIPSPRFIKMAKSAGARFSFGTNNEDRNLGRIDYGVRMVKECGLGARDFFVPKLA